MIQHRFKRERRSTLLQRYTSQLGRIVERDRAEMALLAAKQEAERAAEVARSAMIDAQSADRAKSEFLANISHELRTPLNAIIGFSDLMRRRMGSEPTFGPYVEYAKDINESGQHLLSLIDDILDLAKIEAGKLDLDERRVDVPRAVRACLTLIKDRAQERGLILDTEVPDDLPPIFVDERKFKQIVINLLSNAVKFTPSGGRVSLRAEVRPDGCFEMVIADTGIGIAEDEMWKALAPFRQIDSDLNRNFTGTGLGLPLTKALVERHGGTLTLESTVDVGTTVTIVLPAARLGEMAA